MRFETVFDQIAKKAEMANKAVEGDYIGEDGLLYCHKCNGAKQTRIIIDTSGDKEEKIVPCLCPCKQAEISAKEAAEEQQKFERRVGRYRETGFPEREMQTWNFENDDMTNPRITEAMKKYVEHFEHFRKHGKGLLLYGSCGTGKTYAACEVANALIDKGYSAFVTNFARIINTLQGVYEKQDYIDSLNRFQLLVIDDLGIERDTPYAKEQVFNVVDSRYRIGLPMIITTNLTIDKIRKSGDIANGRIYDRILERCHPVEVIGVSRRRKALQNEYNDTNKLLGL